MPLSDTQANAVIKAHFGPTPQTVPQIVAVLNGVTPAPAPPVTDVEVQAAITAWVGRYPDAQAAADAGMLMSQHLSEWTLLMRRFDRKTLRMVGILFATLVLGIIIGLVFSGCSGCNRSNPVPSTVPSTEKKADDGTPAPDGKKKDPAAPPKVNDPPARDPL